MKKVCLLMEDLPSRRTAGYHTYNLAFIDACLSEGFTIELCVTGPRFGRLATNWRRTLETNSSKISLHCVHGIVIGRYLIVCSVASLARAFPGLVRALNLLRRNFKTSRDEGHVIQIGRFLKRWESKRANRLIGSAAPDHILVDTIFRHSGVPVGMLERATLISHDVFSERCASLKSRGFAPVPEVSAEEERRILADYRRIVAISEHDGASLARLAPTSMIRCLFTPVDDEPVSIGRASQGSFIYVGSAAPHNVDGMRWFLSEVWPHIENASPAAKLNIVGSICSALQTFQRKPNIALHGRLDRYDHLCGPGVVAINPVLAGSGLKVKMVDYFHRSLPCITTSVGAQGFPDLPSSPIVVRDDAKAFAASALELLRNPVSYHELARRCGDYCEHFHFSRFRKGLAAILANDAA